MNLANEILQVCFDVHEKEKTPKEAQEEILRLLGVSGSFYLVQERKPDESGEYDIITKRGRLIKANFTKGDKIGLDRWVCKYEDHRLNEGVMAWGYPINYR